MTNPLSQIALYFPSVLLKSLLEACEPSTLTTFLLIIAHLFKQGDLWHMQPVFHFYPVAKTFPRHLKSLITPPG